MPKRVPGNKSYLIPQKKTIHDPKKGTYLAIRWLAPGESKKQVQEFLGERKKESYTSRYLRKKPFEVDVVLQSELRRQVPKSKSGEQYYLGTNLNLVKRVLAFKKPEEVNGIKFFICLQNGTLKCIRDSERTEKNNFKKFKRTKAVGEKLGEFKEKYWSWVKGTGNGDKRQLGTVLALMGSEYDIRVGSQTKGAGAIEEGPISVNDLKRGMVVTHLSLPVGTPPLVVVEEKTSGGTKVYLRSVEYSEGGSKQAEGDKLREYRKQIKVLERKAQKASGDKNIRMELGDLKKKDQELTEKVNIVIPPKWTELVRVGHYGATQLQARHVKYPAPEEVWLDFIGKSGQRWLRQIKQKELAQAIRDCQKGKSGSDELFPDVDRAAVAKILRKYRIAKPKDLRTYEGTKAFVEESQSYPIPTTKKELRQVEKAIFTGVAKRLGNKPGTAKKAYVDPTVYAAWKSGGLEHIIKASGFKKSFLYVILSYM